MKLTRKTKIRIRKAVALARNVFLALFGVCAVLTIWAARYDIGVNFFVWSVVAAICFGISYALDQLLYETAWSGDKPSPFNR